MKKNSFGLNDEDLADIVDFFEAYSMAKLPIGTSPLDLPIKTTSLEFLLSDMGFVVTEAELISLKEKLDPEDKGFIILPRFVENAGPLFERTRLNEENAEDIYQAFDADQDGLFREPDINVLLSLLGERIPQSYVTRMLQEVDMDGDGAIGYDEFKFFVAGEIF